MSVSETQYQYSCEMDCNGNAIAGTAPAKCQEAGPESLPAQASREFTCANLQNLSRIATDYGRFHVFLFIMKRDMGKVIWQPCV